MQSVTIGRQQGQRIKVKTPAGDLWIEVTKARSGYTRLCLEAPFGFEIIRWDDHKPQVMRTREGA
jgi:hypothetical protein